MGTGTAAGTVGGWPPRVLPRLDRLNTPFWTAGFEGELHITRCAACGHWSHPPAPVCRVCWSDDVAPQPTSGRGVVASFTVNHHAWVPTTDPAPYVVALVELTEQPGLRLVTNIVGCAPSEVRIGMPVRVVFEEIDDVALPLFEPA